MYFEFSVLVWAAPEHFSNFSVKSTRFHISHGSNYQTFNMPVIVLTDAVH